MKIQPQALVLDAADNVATMLYDGAPGDSVNLKGASDSIVLAESVAYGHKVALTFIGKGNEILKYGHRIGVASEAIEAGKWVHLHNMASAVDETFKKRIDSCSTSR